MDLSALDLGLRSAASGMFVMMALVLLQVRPTSRHLMLGIALATGTAAYAVATAPFVPVSVLRWTLPVLATLPVLFWLWARTTFDDEFVLKRWHGAVWLTVAGIGGLVSVAWTNCALATGGARTLAVVSVMLALVAAVDTVMTWRADLVARRRRLRIALIAFTVVFIVLDNGSRLVVDHGQGGSLARGLFLLVLAALSGWSLFGAEAAASVTPAPAAAAKNHEAGREACSGDAPVSDAVGDEHRPVAPALLRRLQNLMTVERMYRQEGLSIGTLAAKLGLPEYRLRQVINEGLGFRNFNAFLNRYRLDDAKAALSDPGQREVPVVTIAMDAGFQSIGRSTAPSRPIPA